MSEAVSHPCYFTPCEPAKCGCKEYSEKRAASQLPIEWPEMADRLYTRAEAQAMMNEAYAEGREDEREQCAQLCEEYAKSRAKGDDESKAQAWMMLQCAAKIRKQP